MGTGVPSDSRRRKNVPDDRKTKRDTKRTAKSSKRRRHDSPSTSSATCSSSSSDFSSDLEVGYGRGPRGGKIKEKVIARQRRSPSRDVALSHHRKKEKKKSHQGERDSKKSDSKNKLTKGNREKKAHGDQHRRRRRSCCKSRSMSVSSEDGYSTRSCSTCRSYSSSPERTRADKSPRSKGNKVLGTSSKTRVRTSSRINKKKSGRRYSRSTHRSRSPSCSSCCRWSHGNQSRSQASGDDSEGRLEDWRLTEKNRSRHPPSISRSPDYTNKVEGRYRGSKYGNEAEIIEDFDDLHNSRSNDSDDGARKGDSAFTTPPEGQHAPGSRVHDDFPGSMWKDSHAYKAEAGFIGEISSSVVVTVPDGGAKWDGKDESSTPRETQPRLKSQVSISDGRSEADDLEMLLRQKALENFQNFRTRLSSNANSVEGHTHKSTPGKIHEVTAGQSEIGKATKPSRIPATQESSISLDHCSSGDDESHRVQLESAPDHNTPLILERSVEKAERINQKLVQKHLGDDANVEVIHDSSFPNPDPCSRELQPQCSHIINREYLPSENMPVSRRAGRTIIDDNGGSRVNTSASAETCDGNASGFEQKTLSVMHGGEMVQVGYKIYVPKKTPALARRRLQR